MWMVSSICRVTGRGLHIPAKKNNNGLHCIIGVYCLLVRSGSIPWMDTKKKDEDKCFGGVVSDGAPSPCELYTRGAASRTKNTKKTPRRDRTGREKTRPRFGEQGPIEIEAAAADRRHSRSVCIVKVARRGQRGTGRRAAGRGMNVPRRSACPAAATTTVASKAATAACDAHKLKAEEE
jgi:hypothetical protein